MQFSPQQERAIIDVKTWLKDKSGPQTFYLAGYAGSGKTTLGKALAEDGNRSVVYGAFTGKAALVMRRKGMENANTIHSLIYRPFELGGGEVGFELSEFSPVKDADLVVIDEVSMVGEDLGRDLLSFGTKVLVLGDPAQLPPVKDTGYFTKRAPDFMLTEIHRQAAENPIIRLSMKARMGERIDPATLGDGVKVIRAHDVDRDEVLSADQVLVGKNVTRHHYNQRIRSLRGFEGVRPNVGERLICLRNNKRKGLLNGGLWDVAKVINSKASRVKMLLQEEGETRNKLTQVAVNEAFFVGKEGDLSPEERKKSDEFDFGYAITTHKSQGSQWDSVYVFDQSAVFREDARRWQYTAITRAAEKLTFVLDQ